MCRMNRHRWRENESACLDQEKEILLGFKIILKTAIRHPKFWRSGSFRKHKDWGDDIICKTFALLV